MKGTGQTNIGDELDTGAEVDSIQPDLTVGMEGVGEGSHSDPDPDNLTTNLQPLSAIPRGFWWFSGALVLAYGWTLVSLIVYAAGKDLHSHILLIPVVSAYLIYSERNDWPRSCHPSAVWTAAFTVLGLASLLAFAIGIGSQEISRNDSLGLSVFSFLCFLTAGGFFFLGKRWMASVAFPVAFLIFMVPLPDGAVVAFETFLMATSADVSDFLFSLFGVPFLRDGQVFQLSTITLEVAQECSGIRSSYVLFITSLLASHMILRSPWRRVLLVAVVIPLGIFRNGIRVLTIGLLCVRYGPHMIDSFLHEKGGPIFFAISLVPLFLLLWVLRRSERAPAGGDGETGG